MEITQEKLQEKIDNGDKLVVDFYTDWCGPCRMMKPIFEKVSEKLKDENSDIQLYTINAENNRDIAVKYGVRGVPTIKVFNDGDVVNTKTGVQQESQLIDLAYSLK
jgi:thioredoxin 1